MILPFLKNVNAFYWRRGIYHAGGQCNCSFASVMLEHTGLLVLANGLFIQQVPRALSGSQMYGAVWEAVRAVPSTGQGIADGPCGNVYVVLLYLCVL